MMKDENKTMIEVRLNDGMGSIGFICKYKISTIQIKISTSGNKTAIIKMDNDEYIEIFYDEKVIKELTEKNE